MNKGIEEICRKYTGKPNDEQTKKRLSEEIKYYIISHLKVNAGYDEVSDEFYVEYSVEERIQI